MLQDRLKVGAASKLETSRAEGALGAAEMSIPQLESDIVAKENQLMPGTATALLLCRGGGAATRGWRWRGRERR